MNAKNENSGVLNETREKFSARSPDWFGRIQISGEVLKAINEGKPVKLAGWNRDGQFGPFISLSISVEKPKEAGREEKGYDWKKAEEEATKNLPPARKQLVQDEEFDDEIPF